MTCVLDSIFMPILCHFGHLLVSQTVPEMSRKRRRGEETAPPGVPSGSHQDADIAFEMQLNEVLAASMGVGLGLELDGEDGDGIDTRFDEGEFLEVVKAQGAELEKWQQEAMDKHTAITEADAEAQRLSRRIHDKIVARAIANMPEYEWDERGDEFQMPFDPRKTESEDEYFDLFFKGLSRDKLDGNGVVVSKQVTMGAVIKDPQGQTVVELYRCLDSSMAGKTAQYVALIDGLAAALLLGIKNVRAYGDSQRVHNQILRAWKVKKKNSELREQVREYISKLSKFELNLGETGPAETLACAAITRCSSKSGDNATGIGTTEQCNICLEDRPVNEMLSLKECLHRFCLSCVSQHAEVKVATGQIPVPCPQVDCNKTLAVEDCKKLLPKKSMDLCLRRMAEMSIPEAHRFYCPYQDCSALMDKGDLASLQQPSSSQSAAIGCVECVECGRYFCVECHVPWHHDMSCSAFQLLPPEMKNIEDAKLFKLANSCKWKQCQQCKCMIELVQGCYHMTCRCGYEFCYLCGAAWQTCSCHLWDEDHIVND